MLYSDECIIAAKARQFNCARVTILRSLSCVAYSQMVAQEQLLKQCYARALEHKPLFVVAAPMKDEMTQRMLLGLLVVSV